MKTKLIAVMLVAGASAFAQGQYGQDYNSGPDYNSAQGNPGYDDPAYNGSPGYNEPQSYGGAPEYYSQAPVGAYGVPPLCAPGAVWIDGYDGVNGYCAVPPYSGAFWIGPRYLGGRFVAGYWSGSRGFVGGREFRGGAGFAGRNDFRSGAFGGRSFAGNNFRRDAGGRQSFTGNSSRSGAQGARSFNGGSSFRSGAPSGRSSGGFSRGDGGRSSGGGHSSRGHR